MADVTREMRTTVPAGRYALIGAPPVQWHWKSSDEAALSLATVKGPPLCHEHETGSTPVAGCVVMVA